MFVSTALRQVPSTNGFTTADDEPIAFTLPAVELDDPAAYGLLSPDPVPYALTLRGLATARDVAVVA